MVLWKRLCIVIMLTLSIGLAGSAKAGETDDAYDLQEEQEIMESDLSNIPEIIMTAVQEAKEGIVITGYREETETGQLVYEVKGLIGKLCYEIEVTENGQVLEIEYCD